MKKKSTAKPEKETYKYEYIYSVLKATEGGPGTATLKSVFKRKREGIKVEFCPSPYVGQTCYIVRATTMDKVKEAYRILKDYGYAKEWKYFKTSVSVITF